jgi:hypothetical protein
MRTGRWLGSALALAACVLLGACRPESRPATGSAADDYFPMVPEARWVYSLRSSLGQLEVEVTARGTMPLPDDGGDVFVMDERNRGPTLGFAEMAPVAYLVDQEFVARISAIDYDTGGGLRLLGQDAPTWILPLDPKAGVAWHQQTRLFETPEGGGARLGWSGEVKPRTSVTVPAGRFTDVVEIETVYRDAGEPLGPSKILYHDYYARGIGLVRSISEDPSGDPSHRIEQVLLEYHFPQ